MPGNLLWAPFYICFQLLSFFVKRIGWTKFAKTLNRIPGGFQTKVQHQTRALIDRKLLGSPADIHNSQLSHYIIEEILTSAASEASPTKLQDAHAKLIPLVEKTLKRYTLTRTASADITNTLLSTAVGAIAWKKFTPGGLGLGIILAGFYAKHSATSHFILGESLGTVYYSIFPPEPSIVVTILSVTLVLCLLSIIAAFSGLITDPLQYLFGLHQKRLRKLVTHLENDFRKESEASFHPKDPYIARIMELFDAIKTHVS